MSGLILPARFRRQPQYPAPVDWGNPLTSDLAFLYNPSVSDRNLVTGAARTGQAGAGLAIETGPFGRSAIAASSTAYRYWDVTFPTGPFTAAIFCIDTQRGVYRLPLHLLDSGGAETGHIRGEPGLVNARVRNTANVSANAYKSDFSEMSATESSLTALVLTPAQSVDLYVNGVGPGYSETVSGTPRAISRILLCNDSSGGSTWSGQLYLVAIWRRALSVAELREFTENPWQLFKYPRRNWVDAATGSTGISGDSSQTLDDVTSSAAAALQIKAASAVTLADVTTAGATNLAIAAAGSQTLADVTGAATGALRNTGASTATLADVTSSATGAVQIKATVGITLADVTASADSDLVITAGSSGQLDNVTLIATGVGTAVNTGASAVTLADVTGSGAATLRLQAASNVTLADVSTAGATTLYLVGASSKTLDAVTSSATGALRNTAASAVTLANVTLSAAGAAEVPRTLLGPRPGGARSTGATRPGSTTASRPTASTRTRSLSTNR